jgi:uncharacterized protein (TIGR02270 family)
LNPHVSDSATGRAYSAPTLPDVILEHLEEFAFLSLQRRKLIFAPDVSLDQFQLHDERIAAHWDGLVVGRPTSIELAEEYLEGLDPWDVFAAVRTWLELGEPDSSEIFERLSKTDITLQPAWREALRRTPREFLQHLIPEGPFASDLPSVQSVLVFAWGWHGLLPEDRLSEFSGSQEPSVRRSLARAMGWLTPSGQKTNRLLEALQADPEQEVGRASLWSAALINPGQTIAHCKERIKSGNSDSFTVRVLGLLGSQDDAELIGDLIKSKNTVLASIRALGDLGNVGVMGLLIELLEERDKEIALAASDAIRTILGEIHIGEGEHGTGSEPEKDSDLLNPASLKEFWIRTMRNYDVNVRLLRGKPFPWSGPPEEEPMESLWRSSIVAPRPEIFWLKKEVPDGFFTARPDSEAIPGE